MAGRRSIVPSQARTAAAEALQPPFYSYIDNELIMNNPKQFKSYIIIIY